CQQPPSPDLENPDECFQRSPYRADRLTPGLPAPATDAQPARLDPDRVDAAGLLRLYRTDRLRQGVPGAADQRRGVHDRHPDCDGADGFHHRHHRLLCAPRQQGIRPADPPDRGGGAMSRSLLRIGSALALMAVAGSVLAAGGDIGQTVRQPTNWTAIIMFAVFVVATLVITKWAAGRTKSASDFYTAGGGITGFQNGLAIAGDYMSAASFLGITAAVMINGYDGLIYAIGFLVGWPILTFLMAERLRNLGRFTFADVAGYRFQPKPIRMFAASGTLVVVLFYLIAQMV